MYRFHLLSLFIVYVPQVNDCVIGVITEKYSEEYYVDINSSFEGRLNVVGFEGATKRNRPYLKVYSLLIFMIVAWFIGILSCPSSLPWNATRFNMHCFEWSSNRMDKWLQFVWGIGRRVRF